jgi:hypothetical protein
MECTFCFHKSLMAIICFVGVAPDTLENIRPGFYKIGNVVSSLYFGVSKLAVFLVLACCLTESGFALKRVVLRPRGVRFRLRDLDLV